MKNKLKILTIIALLGVVLYFFSWPLPQFLRDQIKFYIQQQLPQPSSIGAVHYQFPNKLTITDLSIKQNLATIPRAVIYFSPVRFSPTRIRISSARLNWQLLKIDQRIASRLEPIQLTGDIRFSGKQDWIGQFTAHYHQQTIILKTFRRQWATDKSQFNLEIKIPQTDTAKLEKKFCLTSADIFYNSYGQKILPGKIRLQSEWIVAGKPVSLYLSGQLKNSGENQNNLLTGQANFLLRSDNQNLTGNIELSSEHQLKITSKQPFLASIQIDLSQPTRSATISLEKFPLNLLNSSVSGELSSFTRISPTLISSTYTIRNLSDGSIVQINLTGQLKYQPATSRFYLTGQSVNPQFNIELTAEQPEFFGKIRQANQTRNFRGNYSFGDGFKITNFNFNNELTGMLSFFPNGTWRLKVTGNNFDLTTLNIFHPVKRIVQGKMTGSIEASNDQRLKIFLDTELAEVRPAGENPPVINARIKLSGDETEINLLNANFLLSAEKNGRPTIFNSWGKASGRFPNWEIALHGNLANLNFAGNLLAAKYSFQGLLLNQPAEPKKLQGQFFLEPEIKNFGSISGRLVVNPADIVISRLNWNNWILSKQIYWSRGDGRLYSDLQIRNLPAANLWPLAGFRLNPEATLSGRGQLRGTIFSPEISLRLVNDNSWLINSRWPVSECQINLDYGPQKIAKIFADIRSRQYQTRINARLDTAQKRLSLDSNSTIEDSAEILVWLLGAPKETLPSGQLNLNLAASGQLDKPADDWEITGNIQSKKLTLNNLSFNNINLNFGRQNRNYQFSGTTRSDYGDLNILAAEFDPERKALKLFGQLGNFQIGGIDIIGKINLMANFLASGHLQGELTTENLWVNQHNFIQQKLLWEYQNKELNIHSPEKENGLIARLDFNKNIFRLNYRENNQDRLRISYELAADRKNFQLSTNQMPVKYLTELAGISEEITGGLDATLSLSQSENTWQGAGSFTLTSAQFLELQFDSFHGQFHWQNNILTISQVQAQQGKNYILSGYGYLGITPEGKINGPLDLTLKIEEGNLSFLKNIFPRIIHQARGNIFANLHLVGNWPDISWTGTGRIVNGEITANSYFEQMSKINLSGHLQNNTIVIDDSYARLGEGRITLGGWLKLKGLSIDEFNLNLKTIGSKGVPVNIPELPIPQPLFRTARWKFLLNKSAGQPRLDLTLSGKSNSPKLSGKVILDNTHFTYPSLLPPSRSQPAEFWANMDWDVDILAGENTWYENELANVLINGQIHLSGKGTSPVVNGRIESSQGTIVYLNREFNLQTAALDIVNSQCILEGRAETTATTGSSLETDTISLIIDKTPIEKISPRLVSKINPEYSSEKVFQNMSGQESTGSETSNYQFYLRQQLVRLLDSSLTTPLAKNLLRSLGVADNLRVSYAPSSVSESSDSDRSTWLDLLKGTKYSFQKNISDRLFLGYSITLDDLQKRLDLHHELELSYRWYKNIYLRGVYELGNVSLTGRQPERKLGIEHQYRFGWPAPNDESGKETREPPPQK